MSAEKKLAKIDKFLDKGKFDKIITLSYEPEPEVRIKACEVLGRLDEDANYNRLVAITQSDPDDTVIIAAIKALANIGRAASMTHISYISQKAEEKGKKDIVAACSDALEVIAARK